ncbi:MAG TPA: heme o synthase [Gammaproteobacteria bacterium]
MSATEQQLAKPIIAKSTLANYIELTKPGIVSLSLTGALTGMYFANRGLLPDWHIIIWSFVTLAMAIAGSCMLNHYYDRDIDKLMARTSSRPLATGVVPPAHALALGLVLVAASFILMPLMVNLTATYLTVGAVFGYVVVYTMIAKRRTPWANQLGGIAGAMPPAIGYAAVTGGVDIKALILFAIMVIWQQPHALSLALKYRKEYARAGVPVIPVAKGVQATKERITIYSVVLLLVALLPYFYDMAGQVYLLISIIISTAFLVLAIGLLRSNREYDMRLFLCSIAYLVILFVTMVYDSV